MILVLLAAACIGLLLVIQFAVPPRSGLWTKTFFNSMHLPVFSIIALLVYMVIERCVDTNFWSRIAWAAGLSMGLGVLSEVAQIPIARDASLSDLGTDWLGVGVTLSLVAVISQQSSLPGRSRIATAVLAMFMSVAGFWPTIRVTAAYLDRNGNVPVLYDFDSKVSAPFLSLNDARIDIVQSRYSDGLVGLVTLGDGCWPGLTVSDVWPRWGNYSRLVIELEILENSPSPLFVRISDHEHTRGPQLYEDRFNEAYALEPGQSRIGIPIERIRSAPKSRAMNINDINEVVLFGDCDSAGRVFSLVELRLE